jgi:hypothetical protein
LGRIAGPIGTRVEASAAPGEVPVPRTVKDLGGGLASSPLPGEMMKRLREATLRDERTVPRLARLISSRALEEPRDGR